MKLDSEQSLSFLLSHGSIFLLLICILLPFRSRRVALKKERRPLAVYNEINLQI